MAQMVNEDMDPRDRWLGLRHMKRDYAPTPYCRKTTAGAFIGPHQLAQKAAEYLRDSHWGGDDPPHGSH
eukprot:11310257-Prorocentrum_lima.AAC.1